MSDSLIILKLTMPDLIILLTNLTEGLRGKLHEGKILDQVEKEVQVRLGLVMLGWLSLGDCAVLGVKVRWVRLS